MTGADLQGIEYELPVASAQVKSCVLIAGMLAAGSTTMSERRQSRDHTERILRRSRVPFERDGLAMTVSEVDELELDEIAVPGDPSSAAFMAAAACLVPGSRVVIDDVGLNWTRAGFFRIAQRMGAVIARRPRGARAPTPTTSPSASSTWRTARSRAPKWSPTRCRWRSTS